MHKKLTKYIESYNVIKDKETDELIPNGGMIVLINQESNCEVVIDNVTYKIKSFQSILINAYANNVGIKSEENLNLSVVRFKGAGASFFYEGYLDELMYNPLEPIFLENNILIDELDSYFLERLKVGTIPFNIMKIIDLLDIQKNDYNIDELLSVANVPRRILDKTFRLRAGLTFKTYASIQECKN